MAPQQPQPQQSSNNLIEAELQHNIPVQPHSMDSKNPIAAQSQFVDHNNNDVGLDAVLKDVNNSFKEEEKPKKKSFFSFLKKNKNTGTVQKPVAAAPPSMSAPPPTQTAANHAATADPNPQVPSTEKPKSSKNPKPIITAVVAAIVALGLSAAAFYAFKQPKTTASTNSRKQNSSSSAAKDSVSSALTQEDVKDFSKDIQSNFANLNDVRDFNQTDLSDASLGL
jgi:hypothetical protein